MSPQGVNSILKQTLESGMSGWLEDHNNIPEGRKVPQYKESN